MLQVHHNDRGRALLNSLVVVGILGVLAALIPPAISRARESMRQSQCRKNLEQCGLAMHAYHTAHQLFPPGIVAVSVPGREYQKDCDFVARSETCDWPGSSLASGLTLSLPYLQETSISDAYNFNLACCAAANGTAIQMQVNSFLCPSNLREGSGSPSSYYVRIGDRATPASTDYVLNLGAAGLLHCGRNPFWISGGAVRPVIPFRMRSSVGVFFVNSTMTTDAITDGTSRTFLMGESGGGASFHVGLNGEGSVVNGVQRMTSAADVIACENFWSQGYVGGPPSRGLSNNGGYGSVFGATAWNAWFDQPWKLTRPSQWQPIPPNESPAGKARPTWYTEAVAPGDPLSEGGNGLPGSVGSIQGFRSRHPARVQMLFADGSVRTFSDSVDPFVWVALSTPRGHEQITTESAGLKPESQ